MRNKDRLFIIGQCTLHWGRMEFGNIGNYYIIEPFFEELRRVFPDAEIATTMQFSNEFCSKFGLITVPMEAYYDFNSYDNLAKAEKELEAVENNIEIDSVFVDEVKKASLVIDFSGDIWGENANFLGKDRFVTGCYKDLIAQKLKPTVMLAGSPGPFSNGEMLEIAKKTYAGFAFVTNREPISTRLLYEQGFDISRTYDYACPSFLFKKADEEKVDATCDIRKTVCKDKLNVGVIMCGWNFERGPFDAWPRGDGEYNNFVKVMSDIVKNNNAHLFLLSHSNGFKTPPSDFELIHGRDFPIMEQLNDLLLKNGLKESVSLLRGIYLPDITKGIVSCFDVLISGRMHGAVSGLSQGIPTAIIDYGHEPKAHKLRGFAEVAGVEKYIVDPNNLNDFESGVRNLIDDRSKIAQELSSRMRLVKKSAREQFDLLKELSNG